MKACTSQHVRCDDSKKKVRDAAGYDGGARYEETNDSGFKLIATARVPRALLTLSREHGPTYDGRATGYLSAAQSENRICRFARTGSKLVEIKSPFALAEHAGTVKQQVYWVDYLR